MDPLHVNSAEYPACSKTGLLRTGDVVRMPGLEGKELLKAESRETTYIFLRYGTLDLKEGKTYNSYANMNRAKSVIGVINTKPGSKVPNKLSFLEVDTSLILTEREIGVGRYVFYLKPDHPDPIILGLVENYSFLSRYVTSDPDFYTYQDIGTSFISGTSYTQIGYHFRNSVLPHPSSGSSVDHATIMLENVLYAMQLVNMRKAKSIQDSVNLVYPLDELAKAKRDHNNLCDFNNYLGTLTTMVCLRSPISKHLNNEKKALYKRIMGKNPD